MLEWLRIEFLFGNGCGLVEEGSLIAWFEWYPVAADDAVVSDDGLEDAAVVVGFVAMFLGQDYVSALIANQVFIVRRNKKVFALAEASCAAVVSKVEITAVKMLFMN